MNILNGNSFYVDKAFVTVEDDLTRSQCLVAYVIVTSTASNGIITLGDIGANSTQRKIQFRVDASGRSEIFRFPENPILFPSGIRILDISNCVATLIIKNPGG